MNCEAISLLLDDYIDGTLPAADVARVEAHLATCATCRAELAAIRSILADARVLPRSVMPARDLWNGIEARLDSGPAVGRSGGQFMQRYRVPMLAAAAVLLLLGGALIGRLLLLPPASTAASHFALEQQRYTEATAELARQLNSNGAALPEPTRAVVERNLAIVDAAIAEAEAALTTDPGNTALEQMVLARYEQRLALLKRATQAGKQES